MKTRDMVLTALFAAVICAIAPFSIPIGPIPLTFGTFAIYLAACTLNWKYGTLSVALFVMLGAAGLPVFSNFSGGLQKITGLSGGYIIGYIPCALIIGLVLDTLKRKLWIYIAAMVIGTVLLYTFGTAWYMILSGNTLAVSLALCVTPFLIGDSIKIILVSIITPHLRKALDRIP